MDEIIDGLWLSNGFISDKMILEHKIECLVNCSKDIPFINIEKIPYKIRLFRISVDNKINISELNNMIIAYHKIIPVIEECIHEHKNILIYCDCGNQRSASVVVAYMMKTFNITCGKAIENIRLKRMDVFLPKNNFKSALDKFEDDIKKQY